jgi:hypothetical protein
MQSCRAQDAISRNCSPRTLIKVWQAPCNPKSIREQQEADSCAGDEKIIKFEKTIML